MDGGKEEENTVGMTQRKFKQVEFIYFYSMFCIFIYFLYFHLILFIFIYLFIFLFIFLYFYLMFYIFGLVFIIPSLNNVLKMYLKSKSNETHEFDKIKLKRSLSSVILSIPSSSSSLPLHPVH